MKDRFPLAGELNAKTRASRLAKARVSIPSTKLAIKWPHDNEMKLPRRAIISILRSMSSRCRSLIRRAYCGRIGNRITSAGMLERSNG